MRKYFEFAREQRKLWNVMKMVVVTVIDLEMVPKSLGKKLDEKEVKRRVTIIQMTELLKTVL